MMTTDALARRRDAGRAAVTRFRWMPVTSPLGHDVGASREADHP